MTAEKIIERINKDSEKEIYQHYFKALDAREKVKNRLAIARRNKTSLADSFTVLSSSEQSNLDNFLYDRDPKYCSPVYSARYCEWRLKQLRKGVITINVLHRFE